MPKEEEKKEKLPLYYAEGAAIEIKLNLYREAKEDVIKSLQFLSHLISNIEGKQEEVNRCAYGDMRLAVTCIRLPRLFAGDLVLNEQDVKRIKSHVEWYNLAVKEEKFTNAGVALSDLKDFLVKLREKGAIKFHITNKAKKKAHTPIVIKAKKRINEH